MKKQVDHKLSSSFYFSPYQELSFSIFGLSPNRLKEIKAARRIGELMPSVEPEKRSPEGRKGNTSKVRTYSDIPKQRLSEVCKLAEIPIKEFKERILSGEGAEL